MKTARESEGEESGADKRARHEEEDDDEIGSDIEDEEESEEMSVSLTPLAFAVLTNDIMFVQNLLARFPAYVDHRDEIGRTALHIAMENCIDPNIVSLLLDRGADVDAADMDGTTPMCCAALADNVEGLEILHERGAAFNSTHGWNALHAAAVRGSLNALSFLLMYNKDAVAAINALDDLNDSPLSLALKSGHQKVIGLLLEGGAALDAHVVSQREHWHPRAARFIEAHMRKQRTTRLDLSTSCCARFLSCCA